MARRFSPGLAGKRGGRLHRSRRACYSTERIRRADPGMFKHYGAVVGMVGGVTLLQLANTIFAVILPLQLAVARLFRHHGRAGGQRPMGGIPRSAASWPTG